MLKITFTRRHLAAIAAGLAVIIGIGIITNTIYIFINVYYVGTFSPHQYIAYIHQPINLLGNFLYSLISYITVVAAGVIVGYLARKDGWLYAGLTQIILFILTLVIISSSFFITTNILRPQHNALVLQNIFHQVLFLPLEFILMAFGGWLGQRWYKDKKISLKFLHQLTRKLS